MFISLCYDDLFIIFLTLAPVNIQLRIIPTGVGKYYVAISLFRFPLCFVCFSLSLSPVGSLSPPNSPVLASCCVPGVTSSLEAEKWKRDGGLAAFFLRCSWSLSVASSVSLRRNRGTKVFFLLLFSPPRFCPSLYCIFFLWPFVLWLL